MARDPECYLVNDRPVLIVGTPDGGADCLVFDWASGSFVPDRSYFSRTVPGYSADVDAPTMDEMLAIVAAHRVRVLHHLAMRLASLGPPEIHGRAENTGVADDVDVAQLLGLTHGIAPFDADHVETTIGPGLMVFAPRLLRRHLLDEVLGVPQLGQGPDDTVAASYHLDAADDPASGTTILAVFPSARPEAEAVLVQLAHRAG